MAPVRIRRLDVLLVAVGSPHPLAARLGSLAGIPPLGIAYLASVLRERGVSIRLVDLNVAGWTRDSGTKPHGALSGAIESRRSAMAATVTPPSQSSSDGTTVPRAAG